ncbi:MAG: bifunctional 5,10-methylene-tetrahydrofolate dehydrogenase/5,10-methylene-tetrahydrofolate cyclohydrolase [Tissierellia bacterium]|nr:bifunctional 5,10-methylene-tetrahydrofolate dehydrogenase/5,10-methylene-tetrahydrofolate cyclohydrolase [Tissierellia bacterium]
MEIKELKGLAVANSIKEQIVSKVKRLKANGVNPCVAILRVGDNPDDMAYENGATKRMAGMEIDVKHITLDGDISEENCLDAIEKLNRDETVHGVLILMPLPKHIREDAVRKALSPEKDIDGITSANMARLFMQREGMVPCTPKGVVELLKYYEIPLQGKRVLIIGRSLIVGKPLALMLLNENATVTIAHSRTENLSKLSSEFDIVVCAIGKARFLTKEFVKDGAVIIDVGINPTPDGGITGDVEYETVSKKASAITPVPGGVGSVTTTILAKQLVETCERQYLK